MVRSLVEACLVEGGNRAAFTAYAPRIERLERRLRARERLTQSKVQERSD